MQMIESHIEAVKQLKQAILKSKYQAAKLVNKEILGLYFFVGKYVAINTRSKNWGSGAIDNISALLQQELKGLRGFSAANIKNMRIFYEQWQHIEPLFIKNVSFVWLQNQNIEFRQIPSDEIVNINRQMVSDELGNIFFEIGFSHHLAILQKIKQTDNRIFYIQKAANEFWTYETLKYHLKQQLHLNSGNIKHNFKETITNTLFKQKAIMAFKDEMLLDFININDADEEPDERVLENEIVQNIKKFIMALGADFSFIGNQYRLVIEEEEYFIDLLFYNRSLQSLVAIELKKGKFKAEYVGKMNLYLSALDEYIKQPHENPSIGIILCKEKNNKVVEFAFRDTSKPMGVVTYKTYKELPENYRRSLPNIEDLKNLL